MSKRIATSVFRLLVNQAFLRLAKGHVQPGDRERLQMLASRGILVEDGTSATIRQPPAIALPTCDLTDEPGPSAGLFSIFRQAVSEMIAVRLLRTRSFSKLIAAIERKALCGRRAPSDQDKVLQAIAGAAPPVSYVMREHDRCLVRALAVHLNCMKRGLRPKLVFGVIAHPFRSP